MAEMTALEYLEKKARMTKRCKIECEGCLLSVDNNGNRCSCYMLERMCPEKAIAIVQKWSQEHPGKTFLQDFLEKYPKVPLEDDGMPLACPDKFGYLPQDYGCKLNCTKCWNQSMETEE